MSTICQKQKYGRNHQHGTYQGDFAIKKRGYKVFEKKTDDHCRNHGKENFYTEIQTLALFEVQQIGKDQCDVFSKDKKGTEGCCGVERYGDQQALLLLVITAKNGFDQFQMSTGRNRQKLC
jgi:hypothetical protein